MNPSPSQANLRIEEASLNAWPALQQQLYDGWVLRFSRGFTKRANAVVPLYPSSVEPLRNGQNPIARAELLRNRVRYCENLYAREGLQTVFRLTSISPYPDLDAFLAERGYQLLDPTSVQAVSLQQVPQPVSTQSAELQFIDRKPWLKAYAHLSDLPDSAERLHDALLKSIPGITGYAVLTDMQSGQPLAAGLGVVEGEMLGLFDIITNVAKRRQGLGQSLVQQLLHWGREQGASTGYLQVIQANAAAQALYQRLGFREQYSYWYRVN